MMIKARMIKVHKSIFVSVKGLPQSNSNVSFAGTSKTCDNNEAIPIVQTIIIVLTVERFVDFSLFKNTINKTRIIFIKITTGSKGRFNAIEKIPPKITPCMSIYLIGINEFLTIITPAKGKESPEISVPINPYKIGFNAKS